VTIHCSLQSGINLDYVTNVFSQIISNPLFTIHDITELGIASDTFTIVKYTIK
jgi:hypothetical protein